MIEDHNGHNDMHESEDTLLVEVMDRLDHHLVMLVVGVYACAGLLSIIAFVVTVRFLLGK